MHEVFLKIKKNCSLKWIIRDGHTSVMTSWRKKMNKNEKQKYFHMRKRSNVQWTAIDRSFIALRSNSCQDSPYRNSHWPVHITRGRCIRSEDCLFYFYFFFFIDKVCIWRRWTIAIGPRGTGNSFAVSWSDDWAANELPIQIAYLAAPPPCSARP